VGRRAGLDMCEKSRLHRDFFFLSCASLFWYWTFNVLCIVLYCSWSVRCPLVGNFPPSPPEDAAYWPDTQRTPPAKEGTNGIWPAISQFFRRELGSFTCPKAGTWEACCGFFQQEKSDCFGRERTRDLGYQRPACYPLDHRSRVFDPRTFQPVASRCTD
jgi:hypothetical protein